MAHYPKHDEYNRKEVHSNHGTDAHGDKYANRAGVIAGHLDEWKIKGDTHLYAVKGGHRGVPGKALTPEMSVRANPAEPLELEINGKREKCIMVWMDGSASTGSATHEYLGSGWVPESKVEKGAVIAHAAHTLATTKHYAGAEPDRFDKMHVRDAVSSHVQGWITRGLQIRKVGNPNVDLVEHYVPDGSRCNISLNLPSATAAPVASDVARVTEPFFVQPGTHRTVELFENGKARPVDSMVWVYGCLGNNGRPDPARRGWIPLACLK